MPEPKTPMKNLELVASDIFNEAVIDRLPVGVIVLDRHGRVVKYNRFEERLARRRRADVLGRSFFDEVAPCTNTREIAGVFAENIEANTLSAEVTYAFELPFLPRPRDVRLLLESFKVEHDTYGLILVEDISERVELEREKDRLQSILIHDLNNPLNGILAYASMFNRNMLGPLQGKKQIKAMQAIEESAQRMNRLIQGSLRSWRGEVQKLGPINMHALVLSAIASQLPVAQARSLEVFYNGTAAKVEFPDHAIVTHGGYEGLATLVENLLSNAIKYASRRIDLSLIKTGEQVVLEVTDDGPGIPEEHRERIFEERFQIPGSQPGDGLGLFSVKRTVEEHQGEISVKERGGGGSIFRVVLPA